MGSALAARLPDPVQWNRNRGVTLTAALSRATGPIVVCLFDHHSVHDVLDPVAADLAGRPVINLTTTTPAESRELAGWAAGHGIPFLDGAILAVPEMIGGPGSSIFYSGEQSVFDSQRDLLDRWGESVFLGASAGRAALFDMAMLTGMYTMFGGFLHGAAMLAAEGVPVTEFARRQVPFLAAMTGGLTDYATTVDNRDYAGAGQQSLRFTGTALAALLRATTEQGVPPGLLQPVHDLVARQIEAGHGDLGTARIFEELRSAR
ncbi:NAD(P)-binding domain-containing protein [Actinoplanes couchii]|uniref:Oxidoreductase n=2 Tax=Actinoplanes couchii TaxID=403638 RepID=A0ABQ3XTT2_9ACTN|nr:oxidoreductase [Actinoplanes couchii]